VARKLTLTVNGRRAELEIESNNGEMRVSLDGVWHTAELARSNRNGLYSLLIDGRSWEIFAHERPGGLELLLGNRVYEVETAGAKQQTRPGEPETGAWSLLAPMTGQVIEVRVAPGDAVQSGQTLIIVESMKMNNELTAGRAGVIGDLSVAPGDRIERGRLLLRIE